MKKYLLSLMTLLIALLLICCRDKINEDNETDIEGNIDIIDDTKCYVSFYLDNKLYEKKEIEKNSKVEEITTPTKEGLYFHGWFTKGNVRWDFDRIVENDLDLYASFTTVRKTNMTIEGNKKAIDGTPEKYVAKNTKSGEIEIVNWEIEQIDGPDDTIIATISDDGILTVISSGTVKVIGRSVESDDYSTIIVECVGRDKFNPLIDLIVRDDYILLSNMKRVHISYVFEKENDKELYTNKKLYYTSSDESIATIDETGLITGVREGVCTIGILSDDKGIDGNSPVYKEVSITVYTPQPPTKWELPTELTLNIGVRMYIKPEVGSTVEDYSATYVSSDPDIVTVFDGFEQPYIITNKEGTATIYVTSVADPTKVASIEITVVYSFSKVYYAPYPVELICDRKMYVGYSQQIFYYYDKLLSRDHFSFVSSDESVCIVDERGYVTAVGAGKARIQIVSDNPKAWHPGITITCETEPQEEIKPNLGGHEITVTSFPGLSAEIDPFLEEYQDLDKIYKQRAWREVEEEYNCRIKLIECPFQEITDIRGIQDWMYNKFALRDYSFDVLYGPSSVKKYLFHYFADIKEYYDKYGFSQMDHVMKEAGTYRGDLFISSTGLNTRESYVNLGLFYNYGLLKRLGLDDPAELFIEGKWTYSEFMNWVYTAQEKMGEGKYVLGGHPYYYYVGLTNASGQRITTDIALTDYNLYSFFSKNAMTMMQKLVKGGCVSTVATLNKEKTESGNDFFDEGVLMTTGTMDLINSSQGWSVENGLNWTGEPEFAYVPFPYPDDVDKDNTRVGVPEINVYYFLGWASDNNTMVENHYRVLNDMFLKTNKYQSEDEQFDRRDAIYNKYRDYLSNDASIAAMLYYDASKVFYDSYNETYNSIFQYLEQPSIDVMFGGEEFYSVFMPIRIQQE